MMAIGRIQNINGRGLVLLGLFMLLYGFAQPTWADRGAAELASMNTSLRALGDTSLKALGNTSLNSFASKGMFTVHASRALRTIRTQSGHGSAAPQRSMSDAIAIAKQKVPGEVVSARKQISKKGEVVYHIKILSNQGVVRSVRVQASR